MISRVTQQSAQRSVLANMQKNLSAMAKLQSKPPQEENREGLR